MFLQVSQAEQIKQEREGEKKEETPGDGDKSMSTDEKGDSLLNKESKRKDKDRD